MQPSDLPPEIQDIVSRLPFALPGAVGALIVVLSKHEKKWSGASLSFIICGTMVAFYVAPWLCRVSDIHDTESISLISFTIGTAWNSVVLRLQAWLTALKLPGESK